MLECRRVGSPEFPPGVPPGEEAHDGAMRIFGVIRVLSDRRRLGKAFETRRKLLSLLVELLDPKNHCPIPVPEEMLRIIRCLIGVFTLQVGNSCLLLNPPTLPEAVGGGPLIEFLRAISSALEVLRCSTRKLGMLKGGTFMLSVLI